VPLTQLTGVAARAVGIVAGAAFVGFAFLPKPFAAVLAIPDPVFAGYLVILLAMLFAIGVKIVLQGGLGYREGLVVGIAFLAGVGFPVRPHLPTGDLPIRGRPAGERHERRRFHRHPHGPFSPPHGPSPEPHRNSPRKFGAAEDPDLPGRLRLPQRMGRGDGRPARLRRRRGAAVAGAWERPHGRRGEDRPRLALAAHGEKGDAVLEFVVAPGEENLQDRIAMLEEPSDEASMGREVSLRLLRHLSSSVRHRQYHDTDVITVRVEAPRDSG